jgi:hypothetical protein
VDGLRLIKNWAEFLPKKRVSEVPQKTRGIYALLRERRKNGKSPRFDVVYIGMSRSGIRGRLETHRRSNSKSNLWTHFSIFSVWGNITDEEITELEGLFRAIYRKDSTANKLAVQKNFGKLRRIRDNSLGWNGN